MTYSEKPEEAIHVRYTHPVRRLALPLVLIGLLAALAPAQSSEATSAPSSSNRPTTTRSAPQKKTAKRAAPIAEESLFSRAMTWARKSAYAATKGGQSYAEGLVRKAPKTFASVQAEVKGLAGRVVKNDALKDLDEKRRYVAELWRLRASLDLMALLDANTLQMLTGVDAKTFVSLEKMLSGAAKSLGLTPEQTRPTRAAVTKAAPKG